MKNWIRKKVHALIAWSSADQENDKIQRLVAASDCQPPMASDMVGEFEPFRLSVAKAVGGYIITVHRYFNDDTIRIKGSDRKNSQIYVLTDEQNITEEISKIISMEMLKL